MERRKPEKKGIVIPPIHISFSKSVYVMKPKNMMEVLRQKLGAIDVTNTEEGEEKG
jgi:hypothetical protein